jgi:nitrogen fixation protein FixH
MMRPVRLWPLAVVAALVLTAGANLLVFQLAGDRNAAAVEPDYYRKAVRWDSAAAEGRRSAALGWRADAELGPVTRAGASVTVRLADRDGAPLDGAAVVVAAVHNLDALHPVRARLAPLGGGVYGARLPLRHAGLWELRLATVRGADRFDVTLRRDAVPGSRP